MLRIFVVSLVVLSFFSCKKDTTIGGNIVGGETIDVDVETFELESTAKGLYPLTAYYNGLNEEAHLLGEINDPYLGKAGAKFYFNFFPADKYNFEDVTLDSVVLNVKVDTSNIVGGFTQQYDFKVRELSTDLTLIDTIYNNTQIDVNPAILGQRSGDFNFENPTKYYSISADSIISVEPQIRVKLNNEFGARLMADSMLVDTAANFFAVYNGIELSATPEGSHMLSIASDLTTNASLADNNIELYFKDSNNNANVALYRLQKTNFSLFDVDHAGTKSIAQIENGNKEYFYQQTMGGAYGELELPDLSQFKDEAYVINSAVIEIEQALLDDDVSSALYPNLEGFYLTYKDDEGKEVAIEDISKFSSFSNGLLNVGGALFENKVQFNCTDQIKEYIKGNVGNKLIVKNLSSSSRAYKTIFYGSANTEKSPKLKLTYTKN